MYYLTYSKGLGFRSSLAGRFWLRISHGVAVKLSVRAAVILRLDLGGKPTSKLTHMFVGRPQCFTGFWPEASYSHHVGCSRGLLTAWKLAFLPVNDPRASERASRRKPKPFIT